jgi:tRNA (guanine-N7-)-methyltransferase
VSPGRVAGPPTLMHTGASSPFRPGVPVHPSSPIRLYPGADGFPLDPAAVFGRVAPLVVEVGFGNGSFLGGLAREHPDWNLIGVEIAATSLSRGVGLVRRQRIRNVRLVCADARMLVSEMLPEDSTRRIYLNFPDPWPKERHLERRLLHRGFFRLLSTRLEPDGELWFTTDHAGYFEFALEEATASGLFALHEGAPPPATLGTKYARRWQSEGIRINHVVFRRTGRDESPHPHRLEVVEVAHARLEGDLSSVIRFEKQVHEIEHGHVVLLACTRSLDGRRLLVQVIVEEADLQQEILVEVRDAAGGVYVELQNFGRPAVTRGVRQAVDLVADWLAGLGLTKTESAV